MPTPYVPGSQQGLPAHAKSRLAAMKADGTHKGLFTSDLSVNEFLLVKEAGFDPLGLVVGSSIYYVGWQKPALNQSVELETLTQAMYHARELAMTRMEKEADSHNANRVRRADCGVRALEVRAGRPTQRSHEAVPASRRLNGFRVYWGANVRQGVFCHAMPKLILLRHGESQWNLENRFTGWVDVPLTPRGEDEARIAGEHLRDLPIDKVYTSRLAARHPHGPDRPGSRRQARRPAHRARPGPERAPLRRPARLNKAETAAQYGDEQVKIWRRSYDVPPPGAQGESLKDTAARTLPYFQAHILPDIQAGNNVLVVAHGNSLRSIVMELDQLTREQVLELNIPTGIPTGL